jgi:acyl-ACP thioesterase
MDVFSQKRVVGFSQADRGGRVSPAAVASLFEDAAAAHAEILGVGRGPMLAENKAWILSRLSFEMESRPRADDDITVRSWPRGSERLFAVRDYEILNQGGAKIAGGRSLWLVLDTEKRRPLRPSDIMAPLPLNEGRDSYPAARELPPAGGDAILTAERTALYSDLDCNLHVNNARYIQWALDALPLTSLETMNRFIFDINYLKEITAGSKTALFTSEGAAGGNTLYSVEGRQGEAAMFRAQLTIVG